MRTHWYEIYKIVWPEDWTNVNANPIREAGCKLLTYKIYMLIKKTGTKHENKGTWNIWLGWNYRKLVTSDVNSKNWWKTKLLFTMMGRDIKYMTKQYTRSGHTISTWTSYHQGRPSTPTNCSINKFSNRQGFICNSWDCPSQSWPDCNIF
jgi:hypothetical protein